MTVGPSTPLKCPSVCRGRHHTSCEERSQSQEKTSTNSCSWRYEAVGRHPANTGPSAEGYCQTPVCGAAVIKGENSLSYFMNSLLKWMSYYWGEGAKTSWQLLNGWVIVAFTRFSLIVGPAWQLFLLWLNSMLLTLNCISKISVTHWIVLSAVCVLPLSCYLVG